MKAALADFRDIFPCIAPEDRNNKRGHRRVAQAFDNFRYVQALGIVPEIKIPAHGRNHTVFIKEHHDIKRPLTNPKQLIMQCIFEDRQSAIVSSIGRL